MANHKSARKRARQTLLRRDHNRHRRSGVRTAVKRLRAALEASETTRLVRLELSPEQLREAKELSERLDPNK